MNQGWAVACGLWIEQEVVGVDQDCLGVVRADSNHRSVSQYHAWGYLHAGECGGPVGPRTPGLCLSVSGAGRRRLGWVGAADGPLAAGPGIWRWWLPWHRRPPGCCCRRSRRPPAGSRPCATNSGWQVAHAELS